MSCTVNSKRKDNKLNRLSTVPGKYIFRVKFISTQNEILGTPLTTTDKKTHLNLTTSNLYVLHFVYVVTKYRKTG